MSIFFFLVVILSAKTGDFLCGLSIVVTNQSDANSVTLSNYEQRKLLLLQVLCH